MSTMQMQPPSAALALAIVQAQGAVEEASKDGRNPEDGYTYATADELVRVGKAALKVAGLALLPVSTDIVPCASGGVDLVRCFLLLHGSGASMPLTVRWPVPGDKARDKAAASAYTSSLGYVMRDLLAIPRVMAGEEPMDSRRERAASPAPRDEAMSDGGPVREDLLPPGYRKGTRVWTMAEIRAELDREHRSREIGDPQPVTDTVDVDDVRYYRARWATARKTPWGSVSWLAWKTSTLEPAEFTWRRWTKVSGDWPSHPDDPKPEEDTRSMEEVMGGETLPDLAPANQESGSHVLDSSPVSTVEPGASTPQRGSDSGEAPVANDPVSSSLGLPLLPDGVRSAFAFLDEDEPYPLNDASGFPSSPVASEGALPPRPVVSGGGVADVSHAASGPTLGTCGCGDIRPLDAKGRCADCALTDDDDQRPPRRVARWSAKVYTLGGDEDIDVPCALCGLGIESGDRYVDGTKALEHAHFICVKEAAEGKDPRGDLDADIEAACAYTGPCGDCGKPQSECACVFGPVAPLTDKEREALRVGLPPLTVPSPDVVSLVGKVAEGVLAVADLRGQKRAKVLADAAAKPVAIETVKRGGGVCPSCPVQFRKGDEVEVRGGKRHHVKCPKGVDPREVTT
jgi:hypothetical protein